MSFITILLIAVALSMDSLAVSIASGAFLKCFSWRFSFKMAFVMGGFQAGMTLFGYILADHFSEYITSFDHWIAFGLLFYIGGKMVYDALYGKADDMQQNVPCNRTLLVLGIATSIDALAVGISMAFLQDDILIPSFIIGLTTFILSFVGVWVGLHFGKIKRFNAGLIGGLILLAIGTRILLEHTIFNL